jgi:hypothetical protein
MELLLKPWQLRTCLIPLIAPLMIAASVGSLAAQDVSFDFSRLVEYREVTPADRLERYPHERLIEMRLPISVRFQGLASGEIEHLDFEIDGTSAGILVESFSPTTVLATDAVAVETITKTIKERSLGATLSAAIPVPVGPVAAEVGPSLSAGTSNTKEATEKIKRLPPKRPIVVSGTFAQGRGVFFKFKQSSQTSFEGVHELAVTFAVPQSWQAGGVRISCAARGHRTRWWMDQPTVFAEVDAVVELYPEGDLTLRKQAVRRLQEAEANERSDWGLGELFLTSGSRS